MAHLQILLFYNANPRLSLHYDLDTWANFNVLWLLHRFIFIHIVFKLLSAHTLMNSYSYSLCNMLGIAVV